MDAVKVKFDGRCLVVVAGNGRFRLCVDGNVYQSGYSEVVYDGVKGLFLSVLLFMDRLFEKNKPEERLGNYSVFVGRFLKVRLSNFIEIEHLREGVKLVSFNTNGDVELELRTRVGVFRERLSKSFYLDNINWLCRKHGAEIGAYEFDIDGVDLVVLDKYRNEVLRIGPYRCLVRRRVSGQISESVLEKWLVEIIKFGLDKGFDVDRNGGGSVVRIGNFGFIYNSGLIEGFEYRCGSLRGFWRKYPNSVHFNGRGVEIVGYLLKADELSMRLGQMLENVMKYIEF